jgi:two-component system, NarL family, sensor histidine kinase UhpB
MRLGDSRYDAFFLNSPLAAFVVNGDGQVVSWNPAAAAMFGWSEPEVIGQRLPIVPESSWEEFTRLRAHVLAGNRLTGFEAIRQRKDGRKLAVRISAAPFRESNGRITGVLAMLEDLSITRSLERNVAETTRLLHTLVEALPVAVVVTDAEARIRIWNAAAAAMYGWTASEVVGKPVSVIGSTTAGALLERLASVHEPTQFPATIVQDRRRDGSEFTSAPAAAVVVDVERQLATMAVVRDVSAQVAAERAAIAASEELRALSLRTMRILEEERVRISRDIHDDLGQLLTAVTFELAGIKSRLDRDAPAAERLDAVADMIRRALESIRRIAADLRPPLLDSLGLPAAIQMEVSQFQERTGIECNLSLPGEGLSVRDEAAMVVYRIVHEALTNVARHAAATSVDIRLRQRDGTLFVEVRDDGRGIGTIARGSFGLIGMRERAASVGGELRIEPGRPRGTVVTLAVPVEEPR